MEERHGESEGQGFLPPEPAGPEPELGDRPAPAPPAQPPQPSPPPQQPQGPPPQQTYGYPPPPPGYGYPPPAPGQAPPPPAPGQAPPPGYGYQQYAYPPPPPAWAYPQQQVPDNGPAVAGFVFSLVSGGLLIITGGFSTIISIVCAIVGIIYSRKGKRKVDAGETPKHRGLAQAGFIIGWVSLVLSIVATVAWTLVLAFAIADDDFDWDTDPNTVRVTAVAVRVGVRLIGG